MRRIFSFLLVPIVVFGSNSTDFWKGNDKVCYWETNCKKEKPKKEPKIVKEIAKINKLGDKYLNSLTAKEVKKLYEDVKSYAVMHPNKESLSALTKLTDFIRRKSLKFMYAWVDFIKTHPEYDMQARIGTTSWSYRYLMVGKEKYVITWLRHHSDKVGLYFVCDAKYSVCHEASKAVRYIAQEGIPVVSVAVNCSKDFPECVEKSPEVIRQLGVKLLPAYLIFYRGKGKPVIKLIGSGLISADRLTFELFRNAVYLETGRWIDFSEIPLTEIPK